MISRRNIRVKVMQTLYSVESQESLVQPGETVRLLKKQFDQTRELLVFLIHSITEVARYAEKDARMRASKHLPTATDLNVNTKIAGNQLLWTILENSSYKAAVKEDKPERITDQDLVRKLYLDLVKEEIYQQYISVEGRDKQGEKLMLEFIFNDLLLPNESFCNHLEEHFNNWQDDAEMMQLLVSHFLQKPNGFNFQELLGAEKWQFAKSLLETTLEKKELSLDYIKPKLKNWEPERIALLDMLLMRMGVCEFLFFETIPPKVTINEYIDLAKEYSTPQSGHFVNGILDNIHKDLVRDDKMHKISFKSPK
jgi:N utilization substance protein B